MGGGDFETEQTDIAKVATEKQTEGKQETSVDSRGLTDLKCVWSNEREPVELLLRDDEYDVKQPVLATVLNNDI
jgi:hypothetical protein